MNVFIDLGAFHGLYITRYKKSNYYVSGTKIYAFECNPTIGRINYGSDVVCINKAAWIKDGTILFYISRKNPEFVQGSSVYKDKLTGNLNLESPVNVPCIDFSKFLSDNFTVNDTVIVKMNIEGAEYDVLEKCVADGTIKLIKEIFVSFHYQKIKNFDKDRHNNLILSLKKYPGLIVNTGFGKLNAYK